MRYLALATDYDGTLTTSGRLSSEMESALFDLKKSGRRLLLLTGRTLEELVRDCPRLELFDCIVLENGGILYVPAQRQSSKLCASTALSLVPYLERRGVQPLIVGQTILATRRPHEVAVLEAVRDLGLELQIIFNEDAVTDGTATFPPYGQNILISGPSSAGKSTFATGVIERLIERNYQVCIIDPEGDYGTVEQIVTVGHRLRAPSVDDVLERLEDGGANVVVNLLGLPLTERPDFFAQLFPRLQALRARTGRPHWIVIDEVHHLLPGPWGHASSTLPQRLGETTRAMAHFDRGKAPKIWLSSRPEVAWARAAKEPVWN